MSLYRLEPPERPPQRSPWLITLVLLLLVLLLAGVIWLFYVGNWGLRLAATPTPTATPGVPATPTGDFLATRVAEDQATQIAYQAVVTVQTPNIKYVPVIMGGAEPTTTANINFPIVGGGGGGNELVTPTSVPVEQILVTATTILLPDVQLPDSGNLPSDSPLPTPTAPLVPEVIETETPTPTETLALPTETPTPSPTATFTPPPTAFLVQDMRAFIRTPLTPTPIWLRPAPANTVTPDATLSAGQEVRLLGRDGAGEWLYVCCVAGGQPRWIRQAYAPPSDNALPANAPPSATPNDVRWLPTQPWPGNYPPPPPATPIPDIDFPRLRYDRANGARVPTAFGETLRPLWSVESPPAQTAGRITVPVVVAGQFVVAVSADANLYGFDRQIGNQLWKYSLAASISYPLTVQDNIIYFADDTGRAVAIQVGAGGPLWQTTLAIPNVTTNAFPATGFVAAGSHLFIGVRHENSYRILQMDRLQGGVLNNFELNAVQPKELAIGHRLLYVAGSQLWALDIDTFELVWARSDLTNLPTAPLYTSPGVSATSELYVATGDARAYALEANTGVTLHTYESGEGITGLAVGDNMLYVTGNGFIKAYDRRGNGLFWRLNTSGDARGGALVTPGQLVLVAVNGAIQLINPAQQWVNIAANAPTSVSQGAAVSGPNLYVPGEDGRLYGFTQ